jgi:hypothetical protein
VSCESGEPEPRMDRKSKSTSSRKKSGKRRGYIQRIPRVINSTVNFTTVRDIGNVSSGTTGIISTFFSPSILSTTEISALTTLYSTVKLIAFEVMLTPKLAVNPTSVSAHSTLFIATDQSENGSTAVNPANSSLVVNGDNLKTYATCDIKAIHYFMSVPSSLEFSPIGDDVPTIQTPWAGSPGVVNLWAENLSNSAAYFHAATRAQYILRGRV